jgi:hypothetical protein
LLDVMQFWEVWESDAGMAVERRESAFVDNIC